MPPRRTSRVFLFFYETKNQREREREEEEEEEEDLEKERKIERLEIHCNHSFTSQNCQENKQSRHLHTPYVSIDDMYLIRDFFAPLAASTRSPSVC